MTTSGATRLVYGAFVVFLSAFVVSNVVQVARQVFVASEGPIVGPACAAVLAEEDASIHAAGVAAAAAKTEADAAVAYGEARAASRQKEQDRERICGSDPQGQAAMAAFARLDRAAEVHATRRIIELSPVRHAAQSFIRVPR